MSNLKRYAIFALLDSNSSLQYRNEQHRLTSLTSNKMAFCFPIHITLRGRFIAQEERVLKAFNALNTTFINIPIDIFLSEPLYIQPDLGWREVLPEYKGYENLLCLHNLCEEIVSGILVEDEVPDAYKNYGFRPHITLGWGVTPEAWERFSSLASVTLKQSSIDRISLVSYPHGWPLKEAVNVVLKIT